MATADDYASLIDPTGEAMPIPCCRAKTLPTPHPNPLPQGERGRLPRTITLR